MDKVIMTSLLSMLAGFFLGSSIWNRITPERNDLLRALKQAEVSLEDIRKRRLDEMGDVAKILRIIDEEIVKNKTLEEKWRESSGMTSYFKGASFSLEKVKAIIIEEEI